MLTTKKKVLSTVIGATTLLILGTNQALANEGGLVPEVLTTVWIENNKECAAVSINGNDVVTYKGTQGSGDAEGKAEELSNRIQNLLRSKNLKSDELLPGTEGDLATIKVGDKAVLKFEPPKDEEDGSENAMQPSFMLVNAIREAAGEQKLPESFLTIADAYSDADAFDGTKQDSCFSGKASWYGKKFHGRKAANGERFNMHQLTAAHKKLPFGTKLLVKNRRTGKTCIVRVNDRGPYHGNRVIDLSMGAAKKLNMLGQGVAMVDVMVLGM